MLKVGDKINGRTIQALSADGKTATILEADGTVTEGVTLGSLQPVAPAPPAPKLGATPNVSMLEASDTSLNDRMRAVQAAVSLAYNQGLSSCYHYSHAVFDDYVIVEKCDRSVTTYYKVGYTLDDKGAATLTGDPVAVKSTWVPIGTKSEGYVFGPLSDDEHGHLLEAAAVPTGKKWGVLIIEEGKSKNRNHYARKVLQEAAPLYEGAKMFLDHQEDTRKFGRSTKDVAGFLKSVVPVLLSASTTEADAAPKFALAATAVITKATVREEMLDAWNEGKADLYGLSHDVMAESVTVQDPAGAFYDVTRIESVKSVDLVTNPAAGGRVLRLVASDTPAETLIEDAAMLKKMIEAIKASGKADLVAKLEALGQNPTEDQVLAIHSLLGAPATPAAAAPAAPAPAAPAREAGTGAAPAAPKTVSVSEAEWMEVRRDGVLSFIRESMAGCSLPQLVKDDLQNQLTAQVTEATMATGLPSKASVTAAVKRQVELFGKLAEAKVIPPAAGQPSRIELGAAGRDKISAGFDAFFGVKVEGKNADGTEKVVLLREAKAVSFRNLYVELTGDVRVTGQLKEATRLTEALDSTTFDQILGDSITRRMVADYAQAPQATWRGTIADVVPLQDFRTQRRMRFGGYANLPIVGQGAPYPAMTSPTDEEATYSPAKRGGTEQITIEMIANDDVGAIRRIPVKLARAAAQTLYEFVFDFMRLNPTIYDAVALAAAGHGNNISTTALSATQVTTLRNVMKKQTDMNNGKRMGLAAKYLFVPTDLEELAFQICTSDRAVPDANLAAQAEPAAPNFIKRINITPVVVDYWTDANNYWVTADVSQAPMIEIGFLGGREEPEVFVQDQPNQGSMFSNDQITYKIRHIYGGAVLDYRPFAGGIVP